MNYVFCQTQQGVIGFVGRIHADPSRPTLLVVGGAFPPTGYKHDLVDRFARASVIVAQLPGMDTPPFADPRPETMALAFDALVETLLPGRAITAYGISSGALVTLGMRSAQVRRHVVQEPFFSTGNLWPFIENARERLRKRPDYPPLRTFLDSFFGIGGDGVEDRNYRRLMHGIVVPTDVVHGDLPLEPPRECPVWPSFLAAGDLTLLQANANVTLHRGPSGSGHHVEGTPEGVKLVDDVLEAALFPDRARPDRSR